LTVNQQGVRKGALFFCRRIFRRWMREASKWAQPQRCSRKANLQSAIPPIIGRKAHNRYIGPGVGKADFTGHLPRFLIRSSHDFQSLPPRVASRFAGSPRPALRRAVGTGRRVQWPPVIDQGQPGSCAANANENPASDFWTIRVVQ